MPSHGSPANLAGISKFWLINILADFTYLASTRKKGFPAGNQVAAKVALVSTGICRELADLGLTDLQRREDRWTIVDLIGKGGHVRTVPMSDWVKQQINE